MPVLKVQLSQDMRRIAIEQMPSLHAFQQLIRNLFDTLKGCDFDITYLDEDGDMIRIRTESDWAEAWRWSNLNKVLKFSVIPLVAAPIFNPYPSLAEHTLQQQEQQPIYVSPEDIDFTSSFEDLGFPSEEKKSEEVEKVEEDVKAPYEAEFHRSLEALIEAQNQQTTEPSSPRVLLTTMEEKFKGAMEAFAEFVRNLGANAKHLAEDLEPTFAKVDAFFKPIGNFSEKAAGDLRVEVEKFQAEMVLFKERVREALSQMERPSVVAKQDENSKDENDASSQQQSASSQQGASSQQDLSGSAIKSALSDLKSLEDMGFMDRRRNLELLSQHHGDLSRVVEALLATHP